MTIVRDRCQLFFYIDQIVHKEFVPPGQTVNEEFYREVLRRLMEDMRRKRPEKWRTNDWVLHTLNTSYIRDQETLDVYIRSLILLHDIVLNYA
jgi:hypothetical protein